MWYTSPVPKVVEGKSDNSWTLSLINLSWGLELLTYCTKSRNTTPRLRSLWLNSFFSPRIWHVWKLGHSTVKCQDKCSQGKSSCVLTEKTWDQQKLPACFSSLCNFWFPTKNVWFLANFIETEAKCSEWSWLLLHRFVHRDFLVSSYGIVNCRAHLLKCLYHAKKKRTTRKTGIGFCFHVQHIW